MTPTLPTQQRKTLEFINDYIEKKETGPTSKEIALHLGRSQSAGGFHLRALLAKHLIFRVPGRKRGLEMTPAGVKRLEEDG